MVSHAVEKPFNPNVSSPTTSLESWTHPALLTCQHGFFHSFLTHSFLLNFLLFSLFFISLFPIPISISYFLTLSLVVSFVCLFISPCNLFINYSIQSVFFSFFPFLSYFVCLFQSFSLSLTDSLFLNLSHTQN